MPRMSSVRSKESVLWRTVERTETLLFVSGSFAIVLLSLRSSEKSRITLGIFVSGAAVLFVEAGFLSATFSFIFSTLARAALVFCLSALASLISRMVRSMVAFDCWSKSCACCRASSRISFFSFFTPANRSSYSATRVSNSFSFWRIDCRLRSQ